MQLDKHEENVRDTQNHTFGSATASRDTWDVSGTGPVRGRRLGVRRRLTGAVAAIALLLGITVATAPPASAWSYGWVYISLPTWQGNCNWGGLGRVTIISGTVDGVSSVSMNRNDDLVYMRVRLNDWNRVQFTAFCNKWPGYWQPGFSKSVYPTRNNQTIWVGPAGWSRN